MESRCDEADTAASLPKAVGAVPGGVRDTAGGDPVVAGGAGGAVRVPLLRAALPGVLRRVQVRLRRRQAVRLLRRRAAGGGVVWVPRLPDHQRGRPQCGVQHHVMHVLVLHGGVYEWLVLHSSQTICLSDVFQ